MRSTLVVFVTISTLLKQNLRSQNILSSWIRYCYCAHAVTQWLDGECGFKRNNREHCVSVLTSGRLPKLSSGTPPGCSAVTLQRQTVNHTQSGAVWIIQQVQLPGEACKNILCRRGFHVAQQSKKTTTTKTTRMQALYFGFSPQKIQDQSRE